MTRKVILGIVLGRAPPLFGRKVLWENCIFIVMPWCFNGGYSSVTYGRKGCLMLYVVYENEMIGFYYDINGF